MKKVKINIAEVERSTEKALLISIKWEHPDSMKLYTHSTWIPKSQSTYEGGVVMVAKWLADKIGDDIRNNNADLCRHLGGKNLIYSI